MNSDITNRKLMEKALTESESRWTSLVNEAPTGITLVGRTGLILFVNRGQVGFPEDPPFGRNWKEFLAAELHPVIDQVLADVFSGQSAVFETWRLSADGSKAHFENHVGPDHESGRVRAAIVVTLDVTKQRRADARRGKAVLRQQVLLDLNKNRTLDWQVVVNFALNAAVRLTDSHAGSFAFYSEKTQNFSQASWSGTDVDQDAVTRVWQDVVQRRRPFLGGEWPSGSPIHRQLVIPVFEKLEVVAVLGVANKPGPYDKGDVSELQGLAAGLWQLHRRRDAEQSLDRLYQALEHSPVAILLMNWQGQIQYANLRFFLMSGYSPAEVIGFRASILRSGENQESALLGLETVLAYRSRHCSPASRNRRRSEHSGARYAVHRMVAIGGKGVPSIVVSRPSRLFTRTFNRIFRIREGLTG